MAEEREAGGGASKADSENTSEGEARDATEEEGKKRE